LDGVVRAHLLGERERLLVRVDDDDLGRRVGLQALDPDVPEPAGADHDGLVPAPTTGIAFLTAWMAVSPASASAAIEAGSSDGSSLTTERALVSRKFAKPPSRLMPGK